ncbi:hypothetical protein JCM8097_002942 [Rhodosporidiobolus ruineniae]
MPLHLRFPTGGNTTSSSTLGALTPPFAAARPAGSLATSSTTLAGAYDGAFLSGGAPSNLPTPSLSTVSSSTASYRLSVDPQVASTGKGDLWSTSTASRPTFLLPRPPSPSLHLSFPSPSPAPTSSSSALSSADPICTNLPPLASPPLSPPDSPPLPPPSPVDVVPFPPSVPADYSDDLYLHGLPATVQMGPGDFTGDTSEWEGSVYEDEAEDEDDAMDEGEMGEADEGPVEIASTGTPYDGRSMGVEAFEEKMRRWRL